MDLANWALRTSSKLTTGVKYQLHQGFGPDQRSGNPNETSPPIFTGEWIQLHNAELQALYSSRNIIRNVKSRRLRWAEHIALMKESRNGYRV